jgi:hypothetical protein
MMDFFSDEGVDNSQGICFISFNYLAVCFVVKKILLLATVTLRILDFNCDVDVIMFELFFPVFVKESVNSCV